MPGYETLIGTIDEVTYGTIAGDADEGFVVNQCSVQAIGEIVEREGFRGTRSRNGDDSRAGLERVAGSIVSHPNPIDLVIWLPRILGAAPSGTTYALAETLPSWSLFVKRHAGAKGMSKFAGMKVNSATFRGAEGGFLEMSLDCVGKAETLHDGDGFPSLTPSVIAPYIFYDLVLTLQSSARLCKEFELTINNHLFTDQFRNSQTLSKLDEGADLRTVTLRAVVDHNVTNADLLAQALAGAAGSLAFTNGGYSTSFGFGKLQVSKETPIPDLKGEHLLTLNMTARQTSTTKEIVVTHDSTA